ncbi:MAG: cobalamin biosynthesis protein CobN [Colwellia sp.]|nr:MAG: cobalamin biosynthesis protein CobN [Colwellia sp.]
MKLKRPTLRLLPLLIVVISLLTSYFTVANEALTTKLLFVGSAHSNKAKVTLLKEIANKNQQKNWQITYKSARSLKDLQQAQTLFSQQDIIVFDAVSANESAKTFDKYVSLLNKTDSNNKTKFISLNWLDNPKSHQGFTPKQLQTLTDYWQNAGRKNLANLLRFLSVNILKQNNKLTVSAPIIFPMQGIYHPNQPNLISNSLNAYQAWSAPKKDQPRIAILLQRALIESEQTQLIDATIQQLEEQGIYVVPFFFELSQVNGDYRHLLLLADELANKVEKTSQIDLIISFRNIHWANKRKIEFEQFGVPVIQAMTYYSGDQKAWEADKQGVSAGMMSFTLVLPESAGVVDPMVVAAMDMKSQTTQIIDYQLEHLVNKAVNLVKLKYKANKEKKLTVFIWGDQDVGASFMNIPASLTAISQHLASKGYQTNQRDQDYLTDNVKRILDPFYRDYQLSQLLDDDLAELMPMTSYLTWFNNLPTHVTEPINQYWGDPKDHFMAVERDGEHYFILPRMRDGNVLIMRQPPRTDKKNDEDAVYHQGIVPMNHFYLAAYFYAREYWQSDAIVHLGTHGSQEYLGGKERGLSIYDQGNLAVWDTPVVYPFIVDDVGEAMQTKRRGRATVISHMTPPFAAAGLHGDMSHLHELMHQYKSLDQGGVKQKTAQQIVELCFSTNICKDIAWQQTEIDKNYDGFFDDLHLHMESLATANQPLGLHTFGELAEQELLISTLIQMLGNDFTKLASKFEHEYYPSSAEAVDLDNSDHSHSYHNSESKNGVDTNNDHTDHTEQGKQLEGEIDQLAGFKFVKNYIVMPDKKPSKEANNELPVAVDDLDEALKALVARGKTLYQAMTGIHELEAMTDFLSNKYIPVKTGGDPIRHPESLATGYNLYGFDPSKVPTKAAFEQGKELVDQMIHNYQKKNGKLPDKMAFSLWSIETMRHYGVLESQVLYAMGVIPKWSKGGRVIGTEVIPYNELKRPRIDVVLSATGLYRDAFPSVIQMLAKAVEQVAELKSDSGSMWKNHVALNSQRIQAELTEQGIEVDEAQYLSTIRMFSNASGDYGSGVDGPAWASDTWETDKKISDNYLGKMGFFFGSDSSRWGEKAKNAQGQDIQLYAKQLSGTDIALLSRSSNLFGMLSSDDPFEYFGGISLAVRNIDGKSPDMVISNLRNATNPKAEDAALFMAKELRTRMFHPRWIKAMQKEGYSGAVSLASKMDNFFGWQVVDPNLVRNDQWDEFFDIYVNDKLNIGLDEWFEKTNPASLARMMARMLEAERKDYWQADPERLQQLVEQYMQMVNQYDLIILNDALRENVNQLATGFGLTAVLEQPTMKDIAKQVAEQNIKNKQAMKAQQQTQNEQVEGQKLEKQSQQQEAEPNDFIWQALFTMLFIIGLGGLHQHFRSKRSE